MRASGNASRRPCAANLVVSDFTFIDSGSTFLPKYISSRRTRHLHDASDRTTDRPQPRLFRMWNGIQLRPLGGLLVRRGDGAAADADPRRRLPVPGLPAKGGCGFIVAEI